MTKSVKSKSRWPAWARRGLMENIATVLIAIGFLMLFQPFALSLYTYSFITMVHELRELHNRIHATTVYVTHDQMEAMSMADKIAVMNHGVIEQFGTPREIYDRPATMKKFMNAVDTVLTESLDGFVAAHADILVLGEEHKFVRRRTLRPGKVALISGGGSGHEPLHGEPGRRRDTLKSADAIAEEICTAILGDLGDKAKGPALLFVNGFGGTPLMELYLMYNSARKIFEKRGVTIIRSLVGSYVTSLDMQKIADKEEWTMPATIDDPTILDEITAAMKARGIGI